MGMLIGVAVSICLWAMFGNLMPASPYSYPLVFAGCVVLGGLGSLAVAFLEHR